MSSLTQEIANLVAASNELTERVDGMLTGIDEHIDERIDAALSQSNLTAIITQVINNLAASGQRPAGHERPDAGRPPGR